MRKKRVSENQLYERLLKKEVEKQPVKIANNSNGNPAIIRLHEITSRMENNLQMALNSLT